MRKILYLTLAGLLAALALLGARSALARCLEEDCRPVRPTATTRPPASPTPAVLILLDMSTDMPAPSPTDQVSSSPTPILASPPPGCEPPPPWGDVDLAVRCHAYWPPPLSTPIPNCPPNLALICWGYLRFDPGWFQRTPTPPAPPSPSPPSSYPPAYP